MTDNRATELTATERICEQLEAAGVSFVRSEQIIEGTYWGVTWFVGETKFEFRENDKRTDLMAFNATSEQAIAATLGRGTGECDKTISWVWTGPTTYYSHELSCGHVITSVDKEPPRYCEECGRKVITDEQ